jgi:hypothetical protein
MSACHMDDDIFVFAYFWVFVFAYYVEGEILEQVPKIMKFSAYEQYVFIVNGL